MIESRSYRANPSIWFANAASHVQNMQKELTKNGSCSFTRSLPTSPARPDFASAAPSAGERLSCSAGIPA
jgi:hypothetical protein